MSSGAAAVPEPPPEPSAATAAIEAPADGASDASAAAAAAMDTAGAPLPAPTPTREEAASRRLTNLLRAGATVGQFFQTLYWENQRWYDGRVVDAWVAPDDGALVARVAYGGSSEDIRLDDATAPNAGVQYSVGARHAWLKVSGFPWWPALQLVNSWAVADRRLPEGDRTGRAEFRFPDKSTAPDAILHTHDIAPGQPRVALPAELETPPPPPPSTSSGRASSAAAKHSGGGGGDGAVRLRAPTGLAPPPCAAGAHDWYPTDRQTLLALGEAPSGTQGGAPVYSPDPALLEALAQARTEADRRRAAAAGWVARANAATLADPANAPCLARTAAELARAVALS